MQEQRVSDRNFSFLCERKGVVKHCATWIGNITCVMDMSVNVLTEEEKNLFVIELLYKGNQSTTVTVTITVLFRPSSVPPMMHPWSVWELNKTVARCTCV